MPGRPHAFLRPPTPDGFDASRAAERGADPTGWRYGKPEREAVHRVIAERRDIRRFRPDPVPDSVLRPVLQAAHRAPSVGLMQPTRLVVVRDVATRSAMRAIAQRERLRQAEHFSERSAHFLDQKIEGVVEAPVGVVVCCDRGEDGAVVLGRGTIPQTDVYSTACAVENLWLAARAEGLGVGWVSFYRPDDLRRLLGIPERVEPVAWLCVGWPDERPVRPGLEAAGWGSRLDLDAVVMDERWDASAPVSATSRPGGMGPDRDALAAARDRFDAVVAPAGSLGALQAHVERWAAVTGQAPPSEIRAGVLLCAADHGHVGRGTSLFSDDVSADIVAATVRGESGSAVLAGGHHRLLVADVGLRGAPVEGACSVRVRDGTRDLVAGEALTEAEVDAAFAVGARLAGELADDGVDALVLGEIGIGNTTTAACLAAVLGVAEPARLVGRGAGADAAALNRKRAVVDAALARGEATGGRDALRRAGGLELAALAGAVEAAARLRLPVVLDGFATTVAALCAVRDDPLVAEVLLAGHRSAEPAHALVLTELGLEPILDLRLRLGEGSGALLALPVLAAAGRLHREMGTFTEA